MRLLVLFVLFLKSSDVSHRCFRSVFAKGRHLRDSLTRGTFFSFFFSLLAFSSGHYFREVISFGILIYDKKTYAGNIILVSNSSCLTKNRRQKHNFLKKSFLRRHMIRRKLIAIFWDVNSPFNLIVTAESSMAGQFERPPFWKPCWRLGRIAWHHCLTLEKRISRRQHQLQIDRMRCMERDVTGLFVL